MYFAYEFVGTLYSPYHMSHMVWPVSHGPFDRIHIVFLDRYFLPKLFQILMLAVLMRPCKIDSETFFVIFSFQSYMIVFRSLILVVATVFDKTQVRSRKSTFYVQIHQKLPHFAREILLTDKR